MSVSAANAAVSDLSVDAAEWTLRVDLAAAFRLAARFEWHESVANHFSVALSADGRRFLLNPRWKHFSRIRASDLLALDVDDPEIMQRPEAPDPSAWCIHANLHARVPHARVVLHCHPPYATALSGLADPSIKAIDQVTARYARRVVVDTGFGGIADNDDEGIRLAAAFGNSAMMMMGNHGVTVIAETVARAFEDLYYFERAARTMVLAYSTGQPLAEMDEVLAEDTAAGWDDYAGMAEAHFGELKLMLDEDDPSYAR